MSSGNKPCLTKALGGVQVSAWKNRKDGREYFSCKISRRFKRTPQSEWETSDSFNPKDLALASIVCAEMAVELGIRTFGPGIAAPAVEFAQTADGEGTDPSEEKEEVPY